MAFMIVYIVGSTEREQDILKRSVGQHLDITHCTI